MKEYNYFEQLSDKQCMKLGLSNRRIRFKQNKSL